MPMLNTDLFHKLFSQEIEDPVNSQITASIAQHLLQGLTDHNFSDYASNGCKNKKSCSRAGFLYNNKLRIIVADLMQ